jgi:hypothetical protein
MLKGWAWLFSIRMMVRGKDDWERCGVVVWMVGLGWNIGRGSVSVSDPVPSLAMVWILSVAEDAC